MYCDREVAALLRAAGLSLHTGGYPAELADVVAWLGHRVESGKQAHLNGSSGTYSEAWG